MVLSSLQPQQFIVHQLKHAENITQVWVANGENAPQIGSYDKTTKYIIEILYKKIFLNVFRRAQR